jgi:subtilisin family serine protease
LPAPGALSTNKAYHGLAPNVQLVVLKVLDGTGAGYTSDVVRAIDFAVANKASSAIDVINLSLGHPIYEPASTDPLVQAVERASKAGIIVLAAAGNNGINPTTGSPATRASTRPGNAPSAITVGAVSTSNTVTRNDDRIPDYSSSGPTWYDALVKPDLLAPGHRIIAVGAKKSTIYQGYPELRAPDADYIRLSGTSMATAVGSGVVALMIEQHRLADPYTPALTPNTVKAMLQYSAFAVRNDLGIEYDRCARARARSTAPAPWRSRDRWTPPRAPAATGCSRSRCRGRRSAARTSRGGRRSSGATPSSGAAARCRRARRRGAPR